MTDSRYWIGLSLVHDVGPVLSKKLLHLFGSPESIFHAGMKDLMSVKGVTKDRADNITNFCLWDDIEKKMEVMKREGIQLMSMHDPGYPEILKEIPDAPILLYTKGDYIPEDRFGIAVVGSRKNTQYGEAATRRLTHDLSTAGFSIISGMARGIDTIAHKRALSSGGRTVAVLGSGLDVCYPAENKTLMEQIILSGCVISEFPPGTMPNREHFPRRNRLISGLSLGVLVIEATAESGSLITAQFALDQNREVFAVPGNITSRNSQGTNRLVQQGAKIVLEAEDIIGELAPMLTGLIRREDKGTVPITEEEHILCEVLSREPKHIDLISRDAGMPAQKILGILLSLELKGIARQSSGKRFFLS